MTRIFTTLAHVYPRMVNGDGDTNADAYVSMQDLHDSQLGDLHSIACSEDWHHVATMVERFI